MKLNKGQIDFAKQMVDEGVGERLRAFELNRDKMRNRDIISDLTEKELERLQKLIPRLTFLTEKLEGKKQ